MLEKNFYMVDSFGQHLSTYWNGMNTQALNKEILVVDSQTQFLSDWSGMNIIPKGRIMLNKVMTGCGATTWYITNAEWVILCSPRKEMLKNKEKKHGEDVFYYRALNTNPYRDAELMKYIGERLDKCLPPKILVTYDSFGQLASFLNATLYKTECFRIVVDECQCLLTDSLMKGDTELSFMKDIFRYPNIIFISATPLLDQYINVIPEFQKLDHYYELYWNASLMRSVHKDFHPCKSAKDGFKKIYELYVSSGSNDQDRYFDLRRYSDGHVEYSREACIFLNSVNDIVWIIRKYNLKTEDVNIICSERDENKKKLAALKGDIANTIGTAPTSTDEDPYPVHKKWTFVTKCSFEGTDFVSTNASTYVLCNYNIECLSVDISADIVQIAGRQRLPENVFRDIIHIYYTMDKSKQIDDDAFRNRVMQKIQNCNSDITNYVNAPDKVRSLCQINLWNKAHPTDTYITTANLKPEINPILIAAEIRNYEIFRDHKDITVFNNAFTAVAVNPLIDDLARKLNNPLITYPRERVKQVCDFLDSFPGLWDDVMDLLFFLKHQYGDIAWYFTQLSLDDIKAVGGDTWKMDNLISSKNNMPQISMMACTRFMSGQVYTRKEVKAMLQEIYDSLSLNKKAKATDLCQFVPCEEAKKNGEKGYRVI